MADNENSDGGNSRPRETDSAEKMEQNGSLAFSIESDGALPLSPRTEKYIQAQMLAFALLDDVLGPPCPHSQNAIDEYIAKAAIRIRESIVRGIHASAVDVPADYVDELANRCGSEVFVIRCCKDARKNGILTRKELRQMPLYPTYKNYFNDHPSMTEAALETFRAAGIVDPFRTSERK
jgi:hypothetical protein